MYAWCPHRAEEVLDPWGLELKMVVSHSVNVGNIVEEQPVLSTTEPSISPAPLVMVYITSIEAKLGKVDIFLLA